MADDAPLSALSAGAQWRERVLAAASLEISARDKDVPARLAERLPRGARVHVTFLPNVSYADTVAAARNLAQAGLTPVPHVAARSLRSREALDDYLARLTGEAGVRSVLVIGGDVGAPRGPFTQTLDVLRTGLLQRRGIRDVSFAAHPEGHPVVGDETMARALREKLAYAKDHDLNGEIVTQFAFEAAPIARWIERLRTDGVSSPVRLGFAAPTDAAKMMRFALKCGVGPSLRALRTQQDRMGRLLGEAGPEAVIGDLSRMPDVRESGVVGLHFFVFGPAERAAAWLADLR